MRDLRTLDRFREVDFERKFYGAYGGKDAGVFMIPHPATAQYLRVIASSGEGWDHVSVSLPNRCPNWTEMEFVKRAFFEDNETAMQLHVPPSEHKNLHDYCLHLWRPIGVEIPRPPSIMVAP